MSLLIKNFLPIGAHGVKFRDFIFGDILTSLVKPFTSFYISMCLLTCIRCRENNTRGDCSRADIKTLIIVLCPYTIRFFQCLNKWYYTGLTWLHAANAI